MGQERQPERAGVDGLGARTQNALTVVVLLAAIAAGAVLRFQSLGEPSLWLDEILGFDLATAAKAHPWWSWLTGFDAEHGPLYYATQLAGRVADRAETAARWIPALFGTVTIAIVWAAGRVSAGYATAAAAAAIFATSPLHVYYSREGRPYALLIALAAAMIVALIRGWLNMFCLLLVAALYTSAVSAPLIVSAALVAALSGLLQEDSEARQRDWHAASFAGLLIAGIPLLYGMPGKPTTGVDFPEVSGSFADALVRAFGVTAIASDERGRTAVMILALAIAGAVTLAMRNRRRAAIVIGFTILPIAIGLVALYLTRHWFAVRYVGTALPGYVVLAGAGIAALAGFVIGRIRFGGAIQWAALALIVAMIWSQTIPPSRYEPFQKLDWRGIASAIVQRAGADDLVVTSEGWSTASLTFYLRQLDSKLRVAEVIDPAMAERLSEGNRIWFVTAGHTTDPRMREWICRFPIVLSSALEQFRLHYAPGLGDLLRSRSTPFDRRAVARNDLVLTMGRADQIFLDEHWSAPEGKEPETFRWIEGREASVVVPLLADGARTLRLHVSPLVHRGLPPQTMTVEWNETRVGEVVLEEGVQELTFPVAAREGNNLLEFNFSRANAPVDLDPAHRDERPLSAAFHSVEVLGAPVSSPAPPVRSITLHNAGPLLDERTVWRDKKSRLSNLNPATVQPLLARLGYDPAAVWPRLASGELALESLIETLASSSGCEHDVPFIRRTWTTLFAREPNDVEERVLLSILKSERTRLGLIERISRMTEFRDAFTSSRAGP